MVHDGKEGLTITWLDVSVDDWLPFWLQSAVCASKGIVAYRGSQAMENVPDKSLRNSYTTINHLASVYPYFMKSCKNLRNSFGKVHH